MDRSSPMVTIYKVTNKANGKIYVGQTRETVNRRWKRHVSDALAGRDTYFASAIRKHGADSFDICKLAEMETEERGNQAETLYILLLGSADREKGYNSNLGGDYCSMTAASREKLSNSLKGRVITAEHRQKLSAANTGKTASEETRAKMRDAWAITEHPKFWLGKSFSEEHKLNLREAAKTRPPASEESNDRRSESIKARYALQPMSDETKQLLRDARLGTTQSIETRKKKSIAGKSSWAKLTPEQHVLRVAKMHYPGASLTH